MHLSDLISSVHRKRPSPLHACTMRFCLTTAFKWVFLVLLSGCEGSSIDREGGRGAVDGKTSEEELPI